MKALTLLTKGLDDIDREKESRDEVPRSSLYEKTIDTDMLNEKFLRSAPTWRRLFYRVLPQLLAQVLEAYLIRKKYDVVISWSDPHALLFASLLKLTRTKFPHVALMFWISKPKKAFVLKRVYSHISTMVLWTSTHRKFAIYRLGIPESKIRFISYYVDTQFWHPVAQETDMICSVGMEMRDYPTLIEALRGVSINCHIAAGMARGVLFDTVKAVYELDSWPPNLTVGALSPLKIRDLYARSRFVVVPLLPTDSDNGLTVILEAMAMGKAVICSRTVGQVDVIREGKTGLFVPQGNSSALREAILYLWSRPEIAAEMGREGRKQVEERNTLEQFVRNIKTIAEDCVNANWEHP